MCRIDTGLARKADTWYSGCTKKVMFQKHTGTAILLKWLTTVTVHEGAMSFIHYRTLRANPLFRVFSSCLLLDTYDTIGSFSRWVFGVGEERREDPAAKHPPPKLRHTSDVRQVLSSCSSSGDAVLQSKSTADWSVDVIGCHWAGPTGGATAQAASANHRVISRVQRVHVRTRAHDGREWNTKKENSHELKMSFFSLFWAT